MDRLTQKVEALGDVWLLANGKTKEMVTDSNEYKEYFEKLAEYENLEEQGLLIRFPCKVGDTVYSVSFKKKCVETEKNGGYLIDDELVCLSCGRVYSCESRREYFVEEITATLTIIANIICQKNDESDDFMIYLTREEAEQKLKEMEAK